MESSFHLLCIQQRRDGYYCFGRKNPDFNKLGQTSLLSISLGENPFHIFELMVGSENPLPQNGDFSPCMEEAPEKIPHKRGVGGFYEHPIWYQFSTLLYSECPCSSDKDLVLSGQFYLFHVTTEKQKPCPTCYPALNRL